MAEVLNLALKKDVFEGIINGTSHTIEIDKSKWWTKRLMDPDTGRFKDFQTVRISCGSADKYDYPIWSIESKGKKFIITIAIETEDTDSDPVNDELEPTDVNPIDAVMTSKLGVPTVKMTVSPDDIERAKEHLDEAVEETVETLKLGEPKEKSIKELIWDYFNDVCSRDDVFVVNMPMVRITPDGRVLGTTKKLIADRFTEVRMPFVSEEIVHYKNDTDEDFLYNIVKKVDEISRGCYVFINKTRSGFSNMTSGEDTFVIVYVARKKYQFRNK